MKLQAQFLLVITEAWGETSVTPCHSLCPFSHFFSFSNRTPGVRKAHWYSATDHIIQPYLWPCDHIWANGMWKEMMHAPSGACLATGNWWSGVGSSIFGPRNGSPPVEEGRDSKPRCMRHSWITTICTQDHLLHFGLLHKRDMNFHLIEGFVFGVAWYLP